MCARGCWLPRSHGCRALSVTDECDIGGARSKVSVQKAGDWLAETWRSAGRRAFCICKKSLPLHPPLIVSPSLQHRSTTRYVSACIIQRQPNGLSIRLRPNPIPPRYRSRIPKQCPANFHRTAPQRQMDRSRGRSTISTCYFVIYRYVQFNGAPRVNRGRFDEETCTIP